MKKFDHVSYKGAAVGNRAGENLLIDSVCYTAYCHSIISDYFVYIQKGFVVLFVEN